MKKPFCLLRLTSHRRCSTMTNFLSRPPPTIKTQSTDKQLLIICVNHPFLVDNCCELDSLNPKSLNTNTDLNLICATEMESRRSSEAKQLVVQKIAGGNKNEKKGRRRRFLSKIGCLKVEKEEFDGGFSVQMERDRQGDGGVLPTHLVVMVNGLVGSASNWKFSSNQFWKRYQQDVIVHCSKCNSSMLTFDGIDVMGDRLAEEVISVIKQNPGLQKISFVAHSMGGLVSRYAIGRLYGHNITKEPPEGNGNFVSGGSGNPCSDEKSNNKIAGLEPMNFITLATPHLGSRGHKQVPGFGIRIIEKTAHHVSWILGRTGKHLMLVDRDNGKPPLLLQMITDCEDLRYMSALQSFRRHVTYANSCFDLLVGWRTSSIRRQHELPKRRHLSKNPRYPHIINEEAPKAVDSDHEVLLEANVKRLKTSEMEELMIRGLNKVSWERVDVSFRKFKQRILAHNTIQVNHYSIHSDGADVIQHIIDNFLL